MGYSLLSKIIIIETTASDDRIMNSVGMTTFTSRKEFNRILEFESLTSLISTPAGYLHLLPGVSCCSWVKLCNMQIVHVMDHIRKIIT